MGLCPAHLPAVRELQNVIMKIFNRRRQMMRFQGGHVETAFPAGMGDLKDFHIHTGKLFHVRHHGCAESLGNKAGDYNVFFHFISDLRLDLYFLK